MPPEPPSFDRRRLLSGAAAALALAGLRGARALEGPEAAAAANAAGAGPAAGPIAHLLPTASHDRFLIKASFTEPPGAPTLRIGKRSFTGRAADTEGRFFVFDAPDLEAAQSYELRVADRAGKTVGDAWPLATLPGARERARARPPPPLHLRRRPRRDGPSRWRARLPARSRRGGGCSPAECRFAPTR